MNLSTAAILVYQRLVLESKAAVQQTQDNGVKKDVKTTPLQSKV